MSKKKRCTGCEQPGANVIIAIAGHRLPYHESCALEARRDTNAFFAGLDFGSAFAARLRDARPCGGPAPRADEI